jgi:hypothetical protein
MGTVSAPDTDTRRPRNIRLARRPSGSRGSIAAVVIECVDKTCTVVGSEFSLTCASIRQAMQVVEDTTPQVVWRETTPGFWVARLR